MLSKKYSELKKHFKNNKYITFLSLIDESELLLFYHRSMVNIDLLQKSFTCAIIYSYQVGLCVLRRFMSACLCFVPIFAERWLSYEAYGNIIK